MAKPKTPTTPTTPTDDETPTGETPFEATTVTAAGIKFLNRSMRFLVTIKEAGYADRARREGYTAEEHQIGWRLWGIASGQTRPFDQWLHEEQVSDGITTDNAEQQGLLLEIDKAENTWFPRARAIIRRVVPKQRREAFAAAFFKDLSQQPLGPAVVGSVDTFLARVEGLEKSADADAKAVRTTLRARGLTAVRVAAIKSLLQQAKDGLPAGNTPSTGVSAADVERARVAQLEALEQLRDWFNDWGTTLRSRFGLRDQYRLGLAGSPGRASDEPEDADDEDDADEPVVGDAVKAASATTPAGPATTS